DQFAAMWRDQVAVRMCIFYIHERRAFLYYWELDIAMRPGGTSQAQHPTGLVCNIKSYNRISHTDRVLESYGLEVLWKLGGSAWRLLPVASPSRHFNVWYVRNTSNRLRF